MPQVLVDASAFITSSPQGGFQIGGGIYLPYVDGTLNFLRMARSTDGGTTWVIQDIANSPASSNLAALPIASTSDGTANIFIFYQGPNPGANLACATFNCLTNKWTFNTLSALVMFGGNFIGAAYRSIDNKVIVSGTVAAFNIAGLQRPGFSIFDPSAQTFTAYAAYGSLVNDGKDWQVSSVVAGAGGLTFFLMLTSDPLAINPLRTIQQQSLTSVNVLTAITQIDSISDGGSSIQTFLRASSDGSTVAVVWIPTTLVKSARVYQGASASTVVFSTQTLTLSSSTIQNPQILRVPGSTFFFILQSGGGNAVINSSVDPGSGFAPVTTLLTGTGLTGNPNAGNLQAFPLTSAPWGLAWDAILPPPASIFITLIPSGSGGAGGANPPGGKGAPSGSHLAPAISPSGVPFALALPLNVLKSKQFARNAFDLCLASDWIDIDRRDNYAFSCPKPAQCYLSDPPWIVMPKEGKKFKPIGILPVAGNFTGLDIAVLSMKVDKGYDGVITDIVAQLSATGPTGFVEGSGDVSFRLQQNLHYARDLGNVQVTLGSMTSPGYSGLNRIRLYSGQTVTIFVNLSVAAAARINLAANVICSLNGYMYPRV